jgi:hypothetical protein
MCARDVTEQEVAAFRRNGWVKLDNFISADRAGELLEASRSLLGDLEARIASGDPNASVDAGGGRRYLSDELEADWRDSLFTVRHLRVEPFLSMALEPTLGRAAHRLIDRASLGAAQVPVCVADNSLLAKFPAGGECSEPTPYHQDGVEDVGLDRVGLVNVWIALEEATPEQGTMRFLSGSHREGPLGMHRDDLLTAYPGLAETYAWSEPLHYRPGDATAQHQFTVHGAPANRTDRSRWAYVCTYMAADCQARLDAPLRLGMPAPHERFPQAYPRPEL